MEQTKKCKDCGIVKPISCFREHRWQCKSCTSKDATEWEKKNPEQSKENKRRWYIKHREEFLEKCAEIYKANPEPAKARVAKWTKENKERADATRAAWHAKHPESRHASSKRWKKNNPNAVKAIKRNRRMREKSVPGGGWNSKEEVQLIEDYGHRCAYCGKKTDKLEMDHVVPVSKGGNHSIDNIVPACRFCNTSKSNKPLLVWMHQQRMRE